MSVIEIGHPTWGQADAERIAWALVDQASCSSVQLVPPEGPCDGWTVCAVYIDEGSDRRQAMRGRA
jgi:hypothetical protein